jgi:plastocyanin
VAMTFRIAVAALVLVAAIAVPGHPGGRAVHAAGATVTVANFSFTDSVSSTSTTTIHVGDTVAWTWANTSGVSHSTTSVSVPAGALGWDSGANPSPFTFGPVTFTVPGTYTYHCIVHPTLMMGTVIVQAVTPSVGGIASQPDAAVLASGSRTGGGSEWDARWMLAIGGGGAALAGAVYLAVRRTRGRRSGDVEKYHD